MSIHLILSTLLTVSAVLGHPNPAGLVTLTVSVFPSASTSSIPLLSFPTIPSIPVTSSISFLSIPTIPVSSVPTSTVTSSGPTPTANQNIHPGANSSKCLTAAANADGAAVMIEDCNVGIPSQLWTIFGSTLQIFGNKCLDVTGGATADGTKMQIWTCTGGNTNQQWTISGSSIQWSGHSSCLDLTDGSVANNNTMQIWTCTGGINQKWTASIVPPPPLFPVLNILPGASSTTCLTAPTKVNGGTVVVEPCVSGSEAQTWEVNGPTLVVYGSMCLDVKAGNPINGVKMQIWSCTPGEGDAAQHFTLTADRRIQWANTAECLDLTDGSLTSGNQVQMWACAAGNTNQVWNI